MDAAHVLIPVKAAEGKSRLAEKLSPQRRRVLITAMLHFVVSAAQKADVGPVTIVSATPTVWDNQIRRFDDHGLPWNEALAEAIRAVVTEPIAAIVAADVPTVEPGEIRELVAATPDRGMAIARAHDGGTNAVSMRPPGVAMTHFGEPQSAAVHARTTAAEGLAARILDLPGLAYDVDTPADLERLDELGSFNLLVMGGELPLVSERVVNE